MREKVLDTISNNILCKLFFIVIPLLNEIPVLTPVFNPFMKVGILIGLLFIFTDLFRGRTILKTAGIVPAALLVIFVLIGSLLHFQSEQFKMNLIELCYIAISFFVLYPVSNSLNREKLFGEITLINCVFVGLVTAASVISLILFFLKVNASYIFNNYEYHLGVFNGRLVGIFRNSIYPTATIAMFCAVIQYLVNRKIWNIKKRRWSVLLVISIVINFEAFALQNSKGLLFGCVGAAFFAAFMVAYKCKAKIVAHLKIGYRIVVSAVSASALAGLFYIMFAFFRKCSYWLLLLIENLKNVLLHNGEQSDAITQDIKSFMERAVGDNYGALTGRPYVWKEGIERALEQPLFGYGPCTLANEIHPFEGSTEQLSHFHNIFVHTLVSGGVLGLCSFIVFLCCCIFRIVKSLFRPKNPENYYLPFLAICALLVFIFIINMADTTILFMTKQSGFLFFIYLGYAMRLTGETKPFKVDVLARKIDEFLTKIIVRKNG